MAALRNKGLKNDKGLTSIVRPLFVHRARGGSRTRTGFEARRILSPVRLPVPPLLRWWAVRDLNPRPSACKADALNQLS